MYSTFMKDWNKIPSHDIIEKTAENLTRNGMNTLIVTNGKEAKQKVLELIPQNAEVMDMTSVTLEQIGLTHEITTSGRYNAVKPKLYSLNRETHHKQMQQMGSSPDWSIGSVHAITQDGSILIASNTGSQLAAPVYGTAHHVIFVVGAQKIVSTTDEGIQRIYDYVLPLESKRAQKAYGVEGSFVSKLLIINKEVKPDRITIILIKESLGY